MSIHQSVSNLVDKVNKLARGWHQRRACGLSQVKMALSSGEHTVCKCVQQVL